MHSLFKCRVGACQSESNGSYVMGRPFLYYRGLFDRLQNNQCHEYGSLDEIALCSGRIFYYQTCEYIGQDKQLFRLW